MKLSSNQQANWDLKRIITYLEQSANPEAVAGMARFGITPQHTWGVNLPNLRQLARRIGRNHQLAIELWAQNTRETRILASLVADPQLLTAEQMEAWVQEFDYWEICDQCCTNLFKTSPFAWSKALEWSQQSAEFTRRAGFVLMACLAISDKKSPAERFTSFWPLIAAGAEDQRNMVKKAVNWALRQLGKRDRVLHQQAIALAEQLLKSEKTSARWVAKNALRELTSPAVQKRLSRHA